MIIGQRIKNNVPVEYLYTLGLFHDCGIVPMAIKFDNYVSALHTSNNTHKESLIDIEERLYGTNHATVGYYLATSWHLPVDICQLILRHHDLSMLSNITGSNQQLCYSVLKMSENLVNCVLRGDITKDWDDIEKHVLATLNMSEDDYIDLQEEVIDFLNC